MIDVLYLGAGFALLLLGGDLLVRGSVRVAKRLGISPLFIGIVLVGFGTSMPELVTSVQAAIADSPGIAVGNIVGSNISNVLLILGLSALVMPIVVPLEALRRDGPIVVATVILFAALGYVGSLDRPVGFAFLGLLVAYMLYAYRQDSAKLKSGSATALGGGDAQSPVAPPDVSNEDVSCQQKTWFCVAAPYVMALLGLVLVIVGGKLLVVGATGVARTAGISETVIGLTIVAAGTSMPELVTSMMAALRHHGDVAYGNVLGSSIYNVLGIGGAIALMSPTTIPAEIVAYDNVIMVSAMVIVLFFSWTGKRVNRLEGAILLAAYVTYIYSLIPPGHVESIL